MYHTIIKPAYRKLPLSWQFFLRSVRYQWFRQLIIRRWNQKGRPIPPPPQVKHEILKKTWEYFGYQILVETGTYKGDTVDILKPLFRKIYTIEIGESLFKEAALRFKSYKHVKVLQGDSAKVLQQVMNEINEPSIFWLDGHYSGELTAKGDTECPIFSEIDAIAKKKHFDHVILCDDARSFSGKNGYPTVDQLKTYVFKRFPNHQLHVKDDVLYFIPQNISPQLEWAL